MATKKNAGDGKKKSASSSSKEESTAKKTAEAKSDPPPPSGGGHGAAALAVGHGDAHGHDAGHHKPNIKEYLVMFVVLAVLTALEVGVAKMDIAKTPMRVTLVGLALTKAALVGLYYMHLKGETKILRLTVMLPFMAPALYAVVLISEAAWRLTRW